jgi:DNA-binding transcriptional MocR family regulator
MSYRILGQIIENAVLPANQKLVLIVLANFHNDEIQKAWPSQETLCRLTSLSRATINRALRELNKKGHITVWKERSSGQYPHNVYRINHVSGRHMVKEVSVKNDQTMCQKEPSPCSTVRHYPLRTLKKPLNENSKKIRRNSGLPQSVEEFRELPPFLQEHYWYHKPEIQRLLRRSGYDDLTSARKA